MAEHPGVARRAVLAGAAAGVVVVVAGGVTLAARSSSHDSDEEAGDTSGSRNTGGSPSAASSAGRSATGAAASQALAALADISVGKAVSAQLADGKPAIVTRTATATAVCFSAICPHQGCTVKPGPSSLDCPCHGSRFATTTGAVLQGPAQRGLTKIAVSVQDGKVVET